MNLIAPFHRASPVCLVLMAAFSSLKVKNSGKLFQSRRHIENMKIPSRQIPLTFAVCRMIDFSCILHNVMKGRHLGSRTERDTKQK